MGLRHRMQKILRGVDLEPSPPQSKRRVIAKTADYTCVDGDSGTVFTTFGTSGDVDFTLPTIGEGNGWHAWFMSATNNEMRVISAGSLDDIVAFNDLTADSIGYSTSGEQIGEAIYVVGDGTRWYAFMHIASEATTIVVG